MRLYSALASAALQFLLSQLYRKALGTKHPMGWPAEQVSAAQLQAHTLQITVAANANKQWCFGGKLF